MTLSTTINVVRYTATSGQTVFPYTFRVDDSDHMEVYRNGSLLASGYSLSGIGSDSGGNVTLTSGAAANDNITLRRKVPLTQSLDLPTQGALNTDALEADGLDRGVMIDQQQEEELGRTFKAPVESSVSDLTLTPSASQLIGWNAAGDALVNYAPDGATSSPATDFAKSLLDDPNATAVLSTLGISSFVQTLLSDGSAAAARTTLGLHVVKLALATSNIETTTSSTSYQDVFTLSYAMSDSSHALLLMFMGAIACKQSAGETAGAKWRIYDDTDGVEVGDLLGRVSAGSNAAGDVDWLNSGAIARSYAPGDSDTHLYRLQHKTESGGSQTAFTCIGGSESTLVAIEYAP